MKNGKGEITQ